MDKHNQDHDQDQDQNQDQDQDQVAMSLLDAAASVMKWRGGHPMRCKDIVNRAIARGLLTPDNGRTTANTLYRSILREIKTKGDASRFGKAERNDGYGRGKFALIGFFSGWREGR